VGDQQQLIQNQMTQTNGSHVYFFNTVSKSYMGVKRGQHRQFVDGIILEAVD
jgi:hypothetical protein